VGHKTEEEYLQLAEKAVVENNFKGAVDNYQKLIKFYPQSEKIETYNDNLIDLLLTGLENDYDNVVFYENELSNRISAINDDTTKIWISYQMYDIIAKKGDLDKAEKYVENLTVDNLKLVAQKFVAQKEPQKSIDVYKYIISHHSDQPDIYKIYFLIGFSYSEYLSQYDNAREYFNIIVEKYPECDLADDAAWMLENMTKLPEEITFITEPSDKE